MIERKIDDSVVHAKSNGWCDDDFTYIELRILLNIVQTEGIKWERDDAPWYYYHVESSHYHPASSSLGTLIEPAVKRTVKGIMNIILFKLQERLKRYEV